MKYHVNMMIAKKQGAILNQIGQIRTNFTNKISPDIFSPILGVDISFANRVIELITNHPDWNDEQIYDALFVASDD